MDTLQETDYFSCHYKIATYFLLIPPENKMLRIIYWIIAIPHLVLICLVGFLEAAKLLLGGSGDFSVDILTLGVVFLHWTGVNRVAKWPFHKKDFDAVLEQVKKLNSDFSAFKISNVYTPLDHKTVLQEGVSKPHPLDIYRSSKLKETKKFCLRIYVGALVYLGLNLTITYTLNLLEPVYEIWSPQLNRTQIFRDYPYPLWYPFDISISDGNYWIGFFYQPYAYFFLLGGFFCVDTLCLNIILHLTRHVNILEYSFKFVDKNVDFHFGFAKVMKLKEIRIIKCIKELQAIYKCATDLNNIITMQMLFQQLCMVVIICCTVYRVTSVSVGNELGYLLSVTVAVVTETFIISWFYQNFTLELLQLIGSINDLNWIDYPVNIQKMLLFTIRRLQKPFYFTMGNWHPLNNDVCITTIKTSYSFYTLLTQLK
ncbi:odorant receptor 2a-like [Anthonomus grandis grandis]|uniref:odorant receptor 2a-like n=1 Tax=Anthonomus grandis grandis TaxID=2921223 RepID=UPI0021653FD0|nr:odorant receptor 2a-like [Anthonomus grandis grandis]